jgi:hypothetical protein
MADDPFEHPHSELPPQPAALPTGIITPAAVPPSSSKRARAFDAAPPAFTSSLDQSADHSWKDHLDKLEQWAQANQKDASNDAVAFWLFKVPAIVASASAGVWARFGFTAVGVIVGAIASLCVIVDGIHPRGMLRNTHLRAFHDIRNLRNHMVSQFRSSSAGQPEKTVRKIIRESESERERIAAYIRDAETALEPGHKV